ncbi:hypothetical protein [Anaerophilus nitritogenes]|uniref:hypothetical protein n=1 Tax=Anaerophilus nitritogenes TaxID=2498136 RepID=UPI00101BBCE8|nr:hypothetical protein [Anaerophilus nitritogenes]
MEDILAQEYKWSPKDIDDLSIIEIIKFTQLIKARNEITMREKIAEYKILLLIHHAENPQELYEKLDSIEHDKEIDEEIGDLDKLEKLRNRRTYRR